MRSHRHPHSWTNLLSKWSFGQKKHRARSSEGGFRKLRLERCEERRMLTSSMVNVLYDDIVLDNTDEFVTLREAVALANNDAAADVIDFDTGLDGGTITLGRDIMGEPIDFGSVPKELAITESVTIDAFTLSNLISIDAEDLNGSRIFNIQLSPASGQNENVTLNGLTLKGGETQFSGGAIWFHPIGTGESELTVV